MHTVQLLQTGNTRCFEKVYQLYHSKLYYYILKHSQSEYLAEETVQLTFIRVWENRSSLSLQYNIGVQLFRIARSTMIDLIRRERIASKYILYPVEDLDGKLVQTAETDLKEVLLRLEMLIEDLSPVRKMVFKLSRFEELSHKEIAAQLNISPKTVENHIGRAIRQLKDKMISFSIN